jgi:hypothetical protein
VGPMKAALLLPTIVSGSSWYGLTHDRDSELRACASELGGTITFKPGSQWTTRTTGHEVCAQLNAGGCKKVVDWGCNVYPCSHTSEGSRITECDLAATWAFSCAGNSVETTCSESSAAVWVDSKGDACAAYVSSQWCADGAFKGVTSIGVTGRRTYYPAYIVTGIAQRRAKSGVDASQACCR